MHADTNGAINSLDFHRTEDLLVTAGDDESIRLYSTTSGLLQKTLHSKKYGVSNLVFTHDANSVLYSSKNQWDESLRYLSLHDNRYLRYFKGHRGRVVSVSLSPKSDLFLSASMDRTVRLWDLRSHACQGLLRATSAPCAAFDEQGLIFAASSGESMVQLFDVRAYEKGPFKALPLPTDAGPVTVTQIKFSLSGEDLLVTSERRIHVMDAFDGRIKHIFSPVPPAAHVGLGTPLEASFSPDSQFVLSGGGDGAVRVWSCKTGAEVAAFKGHKGVPVACKWAPRRMLLATGCSAGGLGLWIPTLLPQNAPRV